MEETARDPLKKAKEIGAIKSDVSPPNRKKGRNKSVSASMLCSPTNANKSFHETRHATDKNLGLTLETEWDEKPARSSVGHRVPIDSPTKRLIRFQNKRVSDMQERARRVTPQRNPGKVFVYSNRPKMTFETTLERLTAIEDQNEAMGKRMERTQGDIKEEIERSVAAELVPEMKERILRA